LLKADAEGRLLNDCRGTLAAEGRPLRIGYCTLATYGWLLNVAMAAD
jgi:hypothetical protein